jgi:serine/threonine protein kinase
MPRHMGFACCMVRPGADCELRDALFVSQRLLLAAAALRCYCFFYMLLRLYTYSHRKPFVARLLLQGPLLEQLLGIAKGIDYLHSSDWVVGDLRACNVLLTHAHHQHAASTAAAAAAVAGATSSSPAALAAPSPRVPAGIMQQQQQQQGLTLHRAGSLPCSPQAQMQQQPLLQRAGSLGLAAQQQHHSMSRDDSAGAVTMRLVPKVADLGIGRCATASTLSCLCNHVLTYLSCR